MKKIKDSLLLMFLWGMMAILFPLSVSAQELPELPVSSKIMTGVLDNGISYYLVNNNMDKATVSMALVQRTGTEEEHPAILGETVVFSRGALSELPRFAATSPFDFMNRKALYPGSEGYVSVQDNATIYRFDDVSISSSREAMDSTLLMIFDIISWTTSHSDRYPTSSQAIIVAGNIDQTAFLSKMNMLALLVPKKGTEKSEHPYEWKDREAREFEWLPSDKKGHSSILIRYTAPRTPREGMNTVQSLTSEKLANELNIVLENRLASSMIAAGVPCSVLNSTYNGSSRKQSDEEICLTVSTDDRHLEKAMTVIAGVLSDLDTYGSGLEEYQAVQNEFKIGLGEVYDHLIRRNRNLVDKCISAFLYNAPLSSAQYNYDFFYKRVMSPELELSFFNNYMQAILHPEKNLKIVCCSDAEGAGELEKVFADTWKSRQGKKEEMPSYIGDVSDLKKSFPKAKIKVEMTEPMTGGKIWTFSNGLRVIYKQAGREDAFRYELLIKAGSYQAVNMKDEEKSYLSDIIGLNNIAGMPGMKFRNLLSANGISMNTEVSISDFSIKGTAPSGELPLVLRALLAVGYDRKPDQKTFSYYRDCAALQVDYFKNSRYARLAVLDSMLCLPMNYSPLRRRVDLTDDFLLRADRFYETVFSKASDGILILVGNFEEEELKKTLCRYVGGFKSDHSSVFRSRRQEGKTAGLNILVREGKSPSLDLMFDTPINYTAENNMNVNIAAMAMKDLLAKEAATMGWTLSASGKFVMFPEEKFNYTLQMEPANPDGLPASMVQRYDVDELMDKVNAAISRIGRKGLDEEGFEAYKSLLSSMLDEDMLDPGLVQDFLVLRYSYGKDLMTKYKDKLSGLSQEKVNAILADMAEGAIAEYGVKAPGYGEQLVEAEICKPVLPRSVRVRPATDSLGILRIYHTLFEK